MVKKLFALASVSALAGIVAAGGVAGCTTETVETGPTPDAGASDAKKDAKTPSVGDDEEEPDPGTCASKDPVDHTKIPYTTAVSAPGACTTADVKTLTDYFAANSSNKDFKVSDWAATVDEPCAKCVFTDVDAAKWGPVVVKDDQIAEVNRGGCIELASGNEACGRAYQQFLNCGLLACLPTDQGGFGTCKTQDEFDECRADGEGLYTGPCAEALAGAQKECGSSVGAYEDACKGPDNAKYVFEATIPAHCIDTWGGDAGDGG